MASRSAYAFTAKHTMSPDELAALLGGKGAGLATMTAAGLPVPPGFTLTTEACRTFLADGWTAGLDEVIEAGVAELERAAGKRLGAPDAPLLVSVRSGAAASMPGMMDTVLNVGMNRSVEEALARLSGDATFAADTRRRGLLSYAEIVLGADEGALPRAGEPAAPGDVAAALAAAGLVVPEDPLTQVKDAVRAVFESWRSPRAEHYRQIEGIDHDLGTAATVQSMVFGNLGGRSGTGVALSRNPTTGARGLMGDFLEGAQGEDVVAGGHVTEALPAMGERWPDLFAELERIASMLEHEMADMVDIEFTVEQGRLWMLQARRGKRSPIAAFRMAIDMAEDHSFPVDRAEAVARCRRYFDDPPVVVTPESDAGLAVIATGLGASPGRASGVLCLDPDAAVELHGQGLEVILARRETSPSDVHGMAAARGLFTTLGGQVSHAALVAREWGLPAVVGASEAEVGDGALTGPGGRVEAGTVVTVDGDGGRLLLGATTGSGTVAPEVLTVKTWAAELDAPAQAAGPAPTIEPVEAIDGVVPAFRVLHNLRIKGMVSSSGVAAMCGCDESTIRVSLDELVAGGRATFMEARSMWVISQDGRAAHLTALAAATEPLDLPAIPYEPFLRINDEFKQLCTDWQVRDGEPNDHEDADYDAAIVERLVDLDDRAQSVIAATAEVVPWMAPYCARLAAARDRVTAGDPKALTGVMCDSYHDIWMELHEDLILTQGIDRAAEGST